MLVLLIVPLSEIKSYVVVLSFYIKMMKQRTLQACSLRHSIKKGMFFVLGKVDLFKLGRGGSSPLLAPLDYAPADPFMILIKWQYSKIWQFLIVEIYHFQMFLIHLFKKVTLFAYFF